jgi:hypothetical protein
VSEFEALPDFDSHIMNTVGIQRITLQHEGFKRDPSTVEPQES